MKNINRKISSILLGIIISLISSKLIFASPKNTEILSVNIESYAPKGGWKPSDFKNIKININNKSYKKLKLNQIFINKESSTLLKVDRAFEEMSKYTNVTFKYNNKPISEKMTLKKIVENGKVKINDVLVTSGSEVDILMEIDMDKNMGNDAQGLSSVYSFKIGYKIEDSGGGTITPPEEPEVPEEPKDPEKPEEPGKPEKPEKPEVPEGPERPDEPGKPEGPKDPEKSNESIKPEGPGNNENGSNLGVSTDKLPQTGGIINSYTLTLLGLSVAGIGVSLDRKSSFKKGGKIDE